MPYHVVARGNDKACIFVGDADYGDFFSLLGDSLWRFGVSCLAYCALWNHYHLLLIPGAHSVSRMMQQLNSAYCSGFNRRHHRVGHVLQGRFGARLVEDGAYTRAVLRYIALNPVAAGLVTDPKDWRWSSYRLTVGSESRPDFLSFDRIWLAFGTSDPAIGRARFAEFVHGGLQEAFENPIFHGSERSARELTTLIEPHNACTDFTYGHRCATRPSLGALLEGRRSPAELDTAAYTAYCVHAYTLAEIGRALGRDPSTICRWVRRARARLSAARLEAADPLVNLKEDDRARIKI
jgi:REP element-mobilizing transposase RayT